MIKRVSSKNRSSVENCPWTVRYFKVLFNLPIIRKYRIQISRVFAPIVPYLFLTTIPLLAIISRSRIVYKKIRGKKPSIVYGPTPIVNIIHNSKLDRALGYESDTLVYTTYFITSDFTYSLKGQISQAWLAPFIPYLCFAFAALKYDIFHHYYDWGFLDWANVAPRCPINEYRILRLFGKRIIFSAYGADVRIREITLPWGISGCSECPTDEIGKHCICDTKKARDNYNLKSQYASACLSMGDMTAYTPGADTTVYYWPIDLAKWEYVGVPELPINTPLIVAHAPNHPHFKGTRFLKTAVEDLQNEGLKIELRIIQGLSNTEARQAYSEAHLIAAQFVVGWHGYFEIEAMALGKPTMVFIRDRKWLLAPEECPLINTSSDQIADRLRHFYFNRDQLVQIGKLSRKYVEKYYSFEGASARFSQLYEKVW